MLETPTKNAISWNQHKKLLWKNFNRNFFNFKYLTLNNDLRLYKIVVSKISINDHQAYKYFILHLFRALKKLRYRRRHLDRDWTLRRFVRHHDFDVVREMVTDDFVFLKGRETYRDFQMRNHNMLQAKIRRPSKRCRQVPNSQHEIIFFILKIWGLDLPKNHPSSIKLLFFLSSSSR